MHMKHVRVLRVGAATVALIVATAATIFAWPSSPASAAELLRNAVMATVQGGSATVSFDASVSGPSGSSGTSGSGTVSFLTSEAVFTLGDSAAFPGGADLRITDTGVYLRAPALLSSLLGEGKEWLAFPAPPKGDPPTTTSTTTSTTTTTSSAPPTTAASIIHAIEVLRAQGMEVEEAGVFTINGVQADGYNFRDPDAPDQLAGSAYVEQESGQLTRLEMNTVDAASSEGHLAMDMTKSVDPVDVETPPTETTVDVATLLAPKS